MRRTVLVFFMLTLAWTSAFAQNAGKDLFTAKCAICHSADGSGNTSIGKSMKIRNFHGPDVQKQSDDDLKAMITNGKGKMPSFKDKLTAEQISQLVAFIRDLGKTAAK